MRGRGHTAVTRLVSDHSASGRAPTAHTVGNAFYTMTMRSLLTRSSSYCSLRPRLRPMPTAYTLFQLLLRLSDPTLLFYFLIAKELRNKLRDFTFYYNIIDAHTTSM